MGLTIIGLSGKKQCGKDTVYDISHEQFHLGTVFKLAFADGVKEEVAQACGVTVQYMEANKDIFRRIYQWWGTDFRRNLYGQDYWIKYLANKMRGSEKYYEHLFITDVRFRNEADWIKSQGGKLVRIQRAQDGACDGHQSESDLDNYKEWDYVIENSSSLEHLKIEVEDMLGYFKLI